MAGQLFRPWTTTDLSEPAIEALVGKLIGDDEVQPDLDVDEIMMRLWRVFGLWGIVHLGAILPAYFISSPALVLCISLIVTIVSVAVDRKCVGLLTKLAAGAGPMNLTFRKPVVATTGLRLEIPEGARGRYLYMYPNGDARLRIEGFSTQVISPVDFAKVAGLQAAIEHAACRKLIVTVKEAFEGLPEGASGQFLMSDVEGKKAWVEFKGANDDARWVHRVHFDKVEGLREATDKHWRSQNPPVSKILGQRYTFCGIKVGLPFWLATLAMNITSAPDETLAAGMAAGSKLTAAETAIWHKSWQGVSAIVAGMTPAKILTWTLAIAVLVKLCLLLKYWLDFATHSHCNPWQKLGIIKNVAALLSLGLVSEVTEEILDPVAPLPKQGQFWGKTVVEKQVQGWISISSLALTWRQKPWTGIAVGIASILLGLKSSADNAHNFLARSRSRIHFLEAKGETWLPRDKLAWYAAPCFVLSLVGCNTMRLFGVFLCPSGVLDLTSGCVAS